MSYKIKIFYNNNMKEHDESSRFLQQALKQCGVPVSVNENGSSAVNIARPLRGRPYAPDAPWINFSVTHTGSMWICAAAQTPAPLTRRKDAAKAARTSAQLVRTAQQPAAIPPAVGIDAEYADRRILHTEKIAEKYFSQNEKQYLQERGAASGRAPLPTKKQNPCPADTASDNKQASKDNAGFIKMWTMKEAYLKMLGTGITDDAKNSCTLSDHDVCFLTGEPAKRLENELSAAAGRQIVLSLCFIPGYSGAPQENTEPELEILRLY